MRKLIFYSFVFALLFWSIPNQAQQKAGEIKSKTDFIHPKTKIVFPISWNEFKRERLVSYDSNQNNIGASYYLKSDKKVTTISIYIYPAQVSNENLREQFLAFQISTDRNSTNTPELKPEFIKLNSEKVTINGIRSVFPYNLMIPDFMKGQKEQINQSLITIYDCGKWNMKFRITSESYGNEQLKNIENQLIKLFDPLKLAEENLLDSGRAPKILLSKTVQRDSALTKSSIVEAQAKIDWLDKNKPVSELAAGFSDFEIAAHEHAIIEKLRFYTENKDRLQETTETKTYFENLQKIIEAGYLKDFIYAQTFGVVTYPEGESRKELFVNFRNQNNIPEDILELFYKIYY